MSLILLLPTMRKRCGTERRSQKKVVSSGDVTKVTPIKPGLGKHEDGEFRAWD